MTWTHDHRPARARHDATPAGVLRRSATLLLSLLATALLLTLLWTGLNHLDVSGTTPESPVCPQSGPLTTGCVSATVSPVLDAAPAPPLTTTPSLQRGLNTLRGALSEALLIADVSLTVLSLLSLALVTGLNWTLHWLRTGLTSRARPGLDAVFVSTARARTLWLLLAGLTLGSSLSLAAQPAEAQLTLNTLLLLITGTTILGWQALQLTLSALGAAHDLTRRALHALSRRRHP